MSDKSPALAKLIESIESSLADIAGSVDSKATVEQLAAIEKLLSGIETGIADIASAVTSRTEPAPLDLGPLIAALLKIKPTVHVTTAPPAINFAPVIQASAPVLQFLPAEKVTGEWELRMSQAYGPDRVLKIKRTA